MYCSEMIFKVRFLPSHSDIRIYSIISKYMWIPWMHFQNNWCTTCRISTFTSNIFFCSHRYGNSLLCERKVQWVSKIMSSMYPQVCVKDTLTKNTWCSPTICTYKTKSSTPGVPPLSVHIKLNQVHLVFPHYLYI